MAVVRYRYYALFRAILNDYDEYESDIEIGDLDAQADSLREEFDTIEPYRDPRLEVDNLGLSGDVELIFHFKTNWMDRTSDIEQYLDDVQEIIENDMDLLVTEREPLGYRRET